MLPVYTQVQVKTPEHEYFGRSGAVHATSKKHPDSVVVKFEGDDELTADVALADLQVLG